MPFDPYSLLRPSAVPASRVFTERFHPGIEFTVTLTPLTGFNDRVLSDERLLKFEQDWITGKVVTENGQPVVKEPPAPIVMGGKVFKPTETLAYYINELVSMSATVDGQVQKDFGYWCAMSEAVPNAFADLCRWISEIKQESADALKNEPGADTAPSSDLP